MQLRELSERTGISAASIKFYLREGLVPPGKAVHATRAEYSPEHASRLELIQALRSVVGLSIEQIRTLLSLADDGAPRLQLLAAVQRTVLGLEAEGGPESEAGSEGEGGSDGGGDAVVHLRNWPNVPSDARKALNAHLAMMEHHGFSVPAAQLDAYAQAVDSIAHLDITATTASDDVNQMIKTAAVGMHLHSQLVLKLLALAQASHAIRRFSSSEG